MKEFKTTVILVVTSLLIAACATPPVASQCNGKLSHNLNSAIGEVETRLANGCEYSFDRYFSELIEIAESASDENNKKLFSDFLVRASDSGVISKRQAKERYNRYFNVKFVSLSGDYNTCSQACPVENKLIADMKSELGDKETGLLKISQDKLGYYRANNLLEETQLVLQATCRACAAGGK